MTNLAEKREEYLSKLNKVRSVFDEAGPDIDFTKVTVLGDVRGSEAVASWVQQAEKDLKATKADLNQLDEYVAFAAAAAEEAKAMTGGGGAATFVMPSQSTRGQSTNPNVIKGWAQKVIDSDVIRSYDKTRKMSPTVELEIPEFGLGFKTLLDETGYAPQAVRTGLILPGATRRPVVADLLPSGTTDQIAIVYMEETTTTNGAAAVAEGAAKPESTLAFTEKSSTVRKIATLLPITDELIADIPAMRSYLEGRLRLFLQLAEDSDLLTGSGTAPTIRGLLNISGINTQATGLDPVPDAVYKGMTKIMTTSYLNPSGVIFNPLDWQDVRLLRTADGIYIWGNPSDPGFDTIWGLPVVTTVAMTQNTALVGAFDAATQLFRKTGVDFSISDQNKDYFEKNILTLRVEERLALVVYRPLGLCTVTGV